MRAFIICGLQQFLWRTKQEKTDMWRTSHIYVVLNRLSTTPLRRIDSGVIAPPFLTESSGELHISVPLYPAPIAQEVVCLPEPVRTLWTRKESYFCRESNPVAAVTSVIRTVYRILLIKPEGRRLLAESNCI
jgi:hypothetical protein